MSMNADTTTTFDVFFCWVMTLHFPAMLKPREMRTFFQSNGVFHHVFWSPVTITSERESEVGAGNLWRRLKVTSIKLKTFHLSTFLSHQIDINLLLWLLNSEDNNSQLIPCHVSFFFYRYINYISSFSMCKLQVQSWRWPTVGPHTVSGLYGDAEQIHRKVREQYKEDYKEGCNFSTIAGFIIKQPPVDI